jgi:diphthine-ammonia ligase
MYGVHVCGEGGEYESLVLDGPDWLFKRRLVLDEVCVVKL